MADWVLSAGAYHVTRPIRSNNCAIHKGLLNCARRFPLLPGMWEMVHAARSGRQNSAEGSRAAATSSHTELRLVNVARASLEELLQDYEDYLPGGAAQARPARSGGSVNLKKIPACPQCDGQRALRTAKAGPKYLATILGLHRLPGMQGHPESLKDPPNPIDLFLFTKSRMAGFANFRTVAASLRG